jgi:hypothetical protein
LETETLIREAERERFELEERFLRDPLRFETEVEVERLRGLRVDPRFRIQDPFETTDTIEDTFEVFEPVGETELEFETEAELEARAQTQAEFVRELEFESALEQRRELEIEPFAFEQLREDGADPFDIYREGVRAIETTIRAIEDR